MELIHPPTQVEVIKAVAGPIEFFSFYGESCDVQFQITGPGQVKITMTTDYSRHHGKKPVVLALGNECIIREDFEAMQAALRVQALQATVGP